jgi:hypothetical protein
MKQHITGTQVDRADGKMAYQREENGIQQQTHKLTAKN